MDKNKSPQDILNEIFEHSKESAIPPQRPRFEYPPEDDPFSSPPPNPTTGKSGAASGVKAPLWLSLGLGAALLILAVCVFQLVRINNRLDSFQEAVSGELGSVEQLRRENESLQTSRDLLRERVEKAETGRDNLRQQVQSLEETLDQERRQVMALNISWFVHQFMESGDYHIAAAAAQKGIAHYNFIANQGIDLNPAVKDQFQQDYLSLIDQGYLTMFYGGSIYINRIDKFQDEEKTETLLALWSMLEDYYCNPYSDVGANLLIDRFELFGGAQYGFLRENCSEFTLQQYQQIVDDFVREGQLQWEDGRLVQGPSYTGSEIVYDEDGVYPLEER